jgi:hypothetical protein
MSAAHCVLIIFVHSSHAIFKAIHVENFRKTRKSTTNAVDNYVDGVDRFVNIHKKAKNIYTTMVYRSAGVAAWQSEIDCKMRNQNCVVARGFSLCGEIAIT